MRYLTIFIFFPLIGLGQTAPKTSWFQDNVSIRKSFDGSKNENKPATFALFENHRSDNDFFNADIAVKIIEWEVFPNSGSILTLFPVAEYHRSSNDEDEKDKFSLGLNGEYYFGSQWTLKPYVLSNIVLKRNLLEGTNELKYVGQLSLFGTKPGQPGHRFRFDNEASDYKGTYYPYFGFEYNEVPNLVTAGATEIASVVFIRFFLEYWFAPKSIQFIANGIYRNLISDSTIKKDLPLLDLSLNYYPGRQDHISLGIDYRNGYDPDSRFSRIENTSLSVKVNF